MIMLHELLFSPLVMKECFKIQNLLGINILKQDLHLTVSVRRRADLLIFKNKQNYLSVLGRFQKIEIMFMFRANVKKSVT